MHPTKIPRRAAFAVGAFAVLAVAACTSSSSTTSNPSTSTSAATSSSAAASAKLGTQPLVVETAELSPLIKNFNPLAASASAGWNLHATDLIYEPLFLFNLMNPTQAPIPDLATSASWSADGKTLTVTTRSGVNWTDGKPFSAADVAFTFNLIKANAATADVNGTPVVTSATTSGPNTAVLTFATPEAGNMFAIGSQQIVAQHVWQSVGDPAKYVDANPVGTGPYTVSGFTPQKITLQYNPKYWNVSSIHIPTVIFPGYATGTSPAAVESGEVDWAGNDIANVQNVFVAKNPATNHLFKSTAPYMASNNVVTMLFNTTKAPLDDPKVRQAISYAINRQQLATQGESDYETPATSSGGLLLPQNQSLLSSQYTNDLPTAGDSAKAASILTSDGWAKVGGKWTKNGQTLKFSLKDPSDFTDYYTNIKLIATQLNAQGFDVTAIGEAGGYAPWNTDLQNGNFDAMIHWAAGPQPYTAYQQWLDSTGTTAIGTAASADWGRFKDPAAQTALGQLAAATTPAAQQAAVGSLQQIMSTEVPEAPLLNGALWAEYSTKNYTGWPTESNAYADPGPSNNNDVLLVLLHLTPAS